MVHRRAGLAAILTLFVTLGLVWFTSERLGMNTDTASLISDALPWRQREIALDRAFPRNKGLLAVVVDGATPDIADDAAESLTTALNNEPDFFRSARRPDGGPFFRSHGLLFLSVDEVRDMADQLVRAQGFIGPLAADPSARGLLASLSLALRGVAEGQADLAQLTPALTAIDTALASVLDGKPRPMAWSTLLTGRAPIPRELRRFILVQPVLDYADLSPGGRATDELRATIRRLDLTPERGVKISITGEIALSDEEFSSVAEGMGVATAASLALVTLFLFAALRSWRLILPILCTLLAGLIATAAFAAATVGALNLISVAFAVLFVGIAVDFGIQFSVRYREERARHDDLGLALRMAGRTIGMPLSLAALTTAAGFLSFLPTDYKGVSQLGLIAGAGMLIALVANLTVLPALITLARPKGEPRSIGFLWAGGLDRWLARRARHVVGVAFLLAVAGVIAMPRLSFDFDPLHLKDPKTESMRTLLGLMDDPQTTPYTIDILTPNIPAAAALAARLEKLPEVAYAVTLSGYVPTEQAPKLAALADAAEFLLPTLSPPTIKPPPDAAELVKALGDAETRLRAVARGPTNDARARALLLADRMRAVATAGPTALAQVGPVLVTGLSARLDDLKATLSGGPVDLESLPESLRRDWVAADGSARVQVYPKGDVRTNAALRRFVMAVRAVAPEATGAPVSIQESANTIVGAFKFAGMAALGAIAIILGVALRRALDVFLVLAPLVLAGLLTGLTLVVTGQPLNFANIIALPLLLGVGVAFDIYFVLRWRFGLDKPLVSSTARAVAFSALTTTTAFGSLMLSSHPGTAGLGVLLTLSLAYTLLTTLFFLPALLALFRKPG